LIDEFRLQPVGQQATHERRRTVGISVNDVEITDDAVERELPHHAGAPVPLKAAVEALVVREVLLQAARNKLAAQQDALRALEASQAEDAEALVEDALIERLIELEVTSPVPTDEECETYYRKNIEQFRTGDLVEASHIPVSGDAECSAGRIAGESAGSAAASAGTAGAICRAGSHLLELHLGRSRRQPGPVDQRPDRAGIRARHFQS